MCGAKDIETLERLGKYLLCTGSSMEVLAEEWLQWPHGGFGPQRALRCTLYKIVPVVMHSGVSSCIFVYPRVSLIRTSSARKCRKCPEPMAHAAGGFPVLQFAAGTEKEGRSLLCCKRLKFPSVAVMHSARAL